MKLPRWIGAACGSGAQDNRTAKGAAYFFDYAQRVSPHLFHGNPPVLIHETSTGRGLEALPGVTQFNRQLSELTSQSDFPIVIGGDHSCAVGTWSGVSQRLRGALGLLWVDAHMDAHTLETTESQALHGTPVATLLMEGQIQPQNLALFGVRSFEKAEDDFLKRLGVRVFMMDEIRRRGFRTTWTEALRIVTRKTDGFGITIDLDALDPHEAPAVGSPVSGGLFASEICWGLGRLSPVMGTSQWSGVELAEFNPAQDSKDQTCELLRSWALEIHLACTSTNHWPQPARPLFPTAPCAAAIGSTRLGSS